MRIVIKKDVVGIRKDTGSKRVHAYADDELEVILDEKGYFICPSSNYPDEFIPVMKSNVKQYIEEHDLPGDEEELLSGSDEFYDIE